MAGRIPFPFTLIDARHRPFVDGRRDTLLTLSQLVTSGNYVKIYGGVLVGLFFLFLGGRSLFYDLSVTWKTADARITDIQLRRSVDGKSYNHWYDYQFKTEAGKTVSGHIVLDSGGAYAIGDVVRVYYVESDPNDNYYADDPLPVSFRDWFFTGLGIFVLGVGVYRLRSDLGNYRALRRLAHSGKPLPGEIINSQFLKLKIDSDGTPEPLEVKIDYVAKTADGNPIGAGSATMAPQYLLTLPALPSVGTKVAIWYAEKEGAMLL